MNKVLRFLKNPKLVVPFLGARGFFHGMSDEKYLKLCFKAYMGYDLDLDNPKSFNEKLQWLKLHNRNPLYTKLVDKYEVKPWVEQRIGAEHIVKTLGVWDSFGDIDFDKLPNRFVLKCTHDSGGLAICRDRATFDLAAARKKIEKSLKRNYYWQGREWPYKNVKARIIAEEFLDSEASDLTDYKVMCFDGRARCVFTCTGRTNGDLLVDFFDLNWNHLPFTRHYPASKIPPGAPSRLMDMVGMVERLAKGISFARIDFYELRDEFFFGELTLYPGSGVEEFDPQSWDETLGSWLELPCGGGWLLMSDDISLWMHVEMGNSDSRACAAAGLTDYKFYCFDGEPRFLYVSRGMENHDTARICFLCMDWTPMDIERTDYRKFEAVPEKPTSYEEMIGIARTLSAGIPHVRVDLYDIDGTAKFSEMTFSTNSGFVPFTSRESDLELGQLITLPNEKNGC